jgi:hypothetical protein
MFEPHDSGYPHLHVVYFKKLSECDQETLKKVWSEKYEIGSYERGLYFSSPRPSADGSCVGGTIKGIKNYLMKYVSKSLYSESVHEYEFHGKKIPLEMSLGELLFNSLLKKTKTRLWGCSRFLSQIMKRPEKDGSDVWECTEVDQLYEPYQEDETSEERKEHLLSVLWTKREGLRPSYVRVWELVKSQCFSFPSAYVDSHPEELKIEFDKKTQLFSLYRCVLKSTGG